MKEFLKRYIKVKTGNILNKRGRVIGTHNGAFFYTTGERHGFNIVDSQFKKTPMYVVAKNLNKNTIIVSEKIKKTNPVNNGKVIFLEKVNWINGSAPLFSRSYKARVRYRQELLPCRIFKIGKQLRVVFKKPQEAATVGQSLVIYDKNICLGGGIIAKVDSGM